MAHILVCTNSIYGHVAPVLATVTHLVQRGHRIDWVMHTQDNENAARARLMVQHAGGRVIELPGMDRAIPTAHTRAAMQRSITAYIRLGLKFGHPFYPPRRVLRQQVASLTGYCLGAQPDLIITEMVAAAKIVALRLNLPWVYIPPGIGDWRTQAGVQVLGDALPGMGKPGRWFLNAVDRIGLYNPEAEVRAVAPDLTVPSRSPWLNILGSIAEWEQITDWEPHTYFVGPLVQHSTTQPAPWWDELEGQPYIFISPGTSVREPRFIQQAIDSLHSIGLPLVVATGYQHELDEFRVPSNVYLAQWLDLERALAGAQVAVIVGGWGTALSCLIHAVPALIVPFIIDQGWAGERLEHLGAGLQLQWTEFNATTLRAAVGRLLNEPHFAAAAQQAAARINALGGAPTAADLVESLLVESNSMVQDQGIHKEGSRIDEYSSTRWSN